MYWVLLYNSFMPVRLIAAKDDEGRRLDRILRKALPGIPLSAIHRLLRKGKIKVDGQKALPLDHISEGQIIELPDLSPGNRSAKNSKSKPFSKLEIIYEGQGLLILNKPCGIAVHGPLSLETHVLSYLKPKIPESLSFNPGPLHRLDRPTSGLIVFSKDLEGARFFSSLLRDQKIRKYYLAILDGICNINDEIWEDDLYRDKNIKKTFTDAKGPEKKERAVTRVKTLAVAKAHTLIQAEIITGKTHQIRSQASARKHPLSGDRKYGSKRTDSGSFYLHAWKLELPDTGLPEALPRHFEAPLPQDFANAIKKLFGEYATSEN